MPRSKRELAVRYANKVAKIEKATQPKPKPKPKRIAPTNLVARRTLEFEILDLRRRSYSYEEISNALSKRDPSLTPVKCCQIVREILSNARINYRDKVEDARDMEVRKLDSVESEVQKIMKRSKAVVKLMAVDRVLKIGQERRKILNLDIPKEERHTHEHVVRIYTGLDEPEPEDVPQLDDGNTVESTAIESED